MFMFLIVVGLIIVLARYKHRDRTFENEWRKKPIGYRLKWSLTIVGGYLAGLIFLIATGLWLPVLCIGGVIVIITLIAIVLKSFWDML